MLVAADLRTLARLIPAESRLVIDLGAAQGKAADLVREMTPRLRCTLSCGQCSLCQCLHADLMLAPKKGH